MTVGEPEDGVVEAELFGVQVEVVLGDIPGSNFVGYYWLTPGLVLDIRMALDTLFWSTDIAFSRQSGLDVTLASNVQTPRPAEVSWCTTPGVVSGEWGWGGVGWVGN